MNKSVELYTKMASRGIVGWVYPAKIQHGLGMVPFNKTYCHECAWRICHESPHVQGWTVVHKSDSTSKLLFCRRCKNLIPLEYSGPLIQEVKEWILDSATPQEFIPDASMYYLKHLSPNPSDELYEIAMNIGNSNAYIFRFQSDKKTYLSQAFLWIDTLTIKGKSIIPNLDVKAFYIQAKQQHIGEFTDAIYTQYLLNYPELLTTEDLTRFYLQRVEEWKSVGNKVFYEPIKSKGDTMAFREQVIDRCAEDLYLLYIDKLAKAFNVQTLPYYFKYEKIKPELTQIREFATDYLKKCGIGPAPTEMKALHKWYHIDVDDDDSPNNNIGKEVAIKNFCDISENYWQRANYMQDDPDLTEDSYSYDLSFKYKMLCTPIDEIMRNYLEYHGNKAKESNIE